MPRTTPKALAKGDVIALIAPSTRMNHFVPWRVDRAIDFLQSEGFHVKIIYDKDAPQSPLSANLKTRADEVHSAFLDPTIKAIICCIGGLTANELLPALDPNVIRNNPKIFVGSSDITLLHHFCYVNGLRSFYGPSAVTQLGEWPKPLSFTWEHFLKAVTRPQVVGGMPRSLEFTDEFCDWIKEPERVASGAMIPRIMKPARGWKWLKPGKAEGEIWGGCLPSILQLMGSKWDVSYHGKIALVELPEGDLEATGYPLSHAIYNFNDLRMRGVFDVIKGLVIGRPYLYTPDEEIEWETAVTRALEGFDGPVLAGVDVGHTDPMLTVPLGARVCVHCRAKALLYTERDVADNPRFRRLDASMDEWEVLEAGVC